MLVLFDIVPVLFVLVSEVLGVVPVLLVMVPLDEGVVVVPMVPGVTAGCVVSRMVPSGLRLVVSVCA